MHHYSYYISLDEPVVNAVKKLAREQPELGQCNSTVRRNVGVAQHFASLESPNSAPKLTEELPKDRMIG